MPEKGKKLRQVAGKYGVTRVRLFGSHATSRAVGTSHLDLLVDLKPGRDLLDLVAFNLGVETPLGCKVGVVTEKGLSPYLRRRILREARPL